MANSNQGNDGKQVSKFGGIEPNVQLDSQFSFPERSRKGYVMGEADMQYGNVSGFRFGMEKTGMRHKQSSLGKKVRG